MKLSLDNSFFFSFGFNGTNLRCIQVSEKRSNCPMKLRKAFIALFKDFRKWGLLPLIFNGPINDVYDDLHFLLLFVIIYASRQMGN